MAMCIQTYDLEPLNTPSITDFYGMNKVRVYDDGTEVLNDCDSSVCIWHNEQPTMLIRHPSDWEWKAIREFLIQKGFKNKNIKVKEMRERYGIKYGQKVGTILFQRIMGRNDSEVC